MNRQDNQHEYDDMQAWAAEMELEQQYLEAQGTANETV